MTREELLVDLVARILAMPDDRPRLVAIDGMSCVGKSTLAAEVTSLLGSADIPVLAVSYDDFHHPAEVRRRRGRLSAEGYLEDSYDAAALRERVLDPAVNGGEVRTASFDLASDHPVDPPGEELPAGSVVVVEGEFLLDAALAEFWDLAVLLVADPEQVLARAVARDAELGGPEQVRERYLRRYFAAWSLHEDRNDPWSRADVVVDLSDPQTPRALS